VATSHGDSVLFATAAFLVLADALEHSALRNLGRALLIEPLLLLAMVENGRRIVWVMLLVQVGVAFAFGPMRAWKRLVIRAGLLLLPLAALYVTVGWNRPTGIFSPLNTLRGVSDTSYDHSAYWREVENWNLAVNVGYHPFLGAGLGGRYLEVMPNDDISELYREYREWPHNTVLGQLMLMGLLGFTVVWSVFAAGLYLAFRAYRAAVSQEHRVAALGCIGGVVGCHMLAYGDTGAHYPQYKVVMALAIAMAGKLALATGAWPRPSPRRRSATAAAPDTAAPPLSGLDAAGHSAPP
jgi:O-antigen ligase